MYSSFFYFLLLLVDIKSTHMNSIYKFEELKLCKDIFDTRGSSANSVKLQ